MLLCSSAALQPACTGGPTRLPAPATRVWRVPLQRSAPVSARRGVAAARTAPMRLRITGTSNVVVAAAATASLPGRRTWEWNGMQVRYQVFGEENATPVVLIHGFGASSDHFRGNAPALAESGYRCYSIDLLGYGFSDKPTPNNESTLFQGELPSNVMYPTPTRLYSFETWSQQVHDFVQEVVWEGSSSATQKNKEGVLLVTNSIGGMVALQTAVSFPNTVKAMCLFNVSLRMLHVEKQQPLIRPLVRGFQTFLRESGAGQLFFSALAKAPTVKNVLKEAYHDPDTVTDELVELFLKPGMEPGATEVFLDFISYSVGPMVEELLAANEKPVVLGWGDKDPWEKLEWGYDLAKFDCVSRLDVVKNAGHSPQDEDPEQSNRIILDFLKEHAAIA